jgi:hypothetical protein
VAAALYYFYLRPQYKTPDEMVRLLPRADAVLFYADLGTLRAAGVLASIQGSKTVQEPDYQQFVSETGLAYDRDLDAVAAASLPNQLFAVLRGRFDWKHLNAYALKQGGRCRDNYCQVASKNTGRWLSFFPIRKDLMALAISSDPNAAYTLLPTSGAPPVSTPLYPVWAQLPKRLLDHPESVPPAAQVFLQALSSASEVTFGVERAPDASESGFLVRMQAQFASDREASAVSEHLTRLTKLLGAVSSKNASDPANQKLHEALTSAVFLASNRQVKGEWHVSRQLFDSLLE